MTLEEVKKEASELDDCSLFELVTYLTAELEQRNYCYRLQLAATDKAEYAGLPF